MRKMSLLYITLSLFGLIILAGSSCDPHKDAAQHDSALAAAQLSAPSGLPSSGIVEQIAKGDFAQAARLLEQNSTADRETLAKLVSRYELLQQSRQEEKQKSLQEQMEELRKIQDKVGDGEVVDVNDIDEAMVAVIRAREFVPEDQKGEILQDPFVQKVLTQLKTNAGQYETEGKWIDAYIHGYYWLQALDEDNKTFKEKADELTELAAIELALKDSACSETAIERHKGIEPVMFLRALHLLDTNYVLPIEYRDMADKALKRCEMLGRVLANTQEKLAWSADAESIRKWQSGLEAVEAQLKHEFKSDKMKAENLAELLEDIVALDAITLKLPNEVIIAQFTEAAFSALDPFTNMVWPWSVKDFEKSMTQQFTGIGVEISKSTGVLRVVSPLPDTPAYAAGMDADDEILAVNGEETKEMTISCAVSKIMGPKGTKVTLRVRRPSTGETKEMTITRAKIVVHPLRGWTRQADGNWDFMIDPENNIGYVRLTAFTESTGSDLDKVLKQLGKQGIKGLILDLRFNSGGYLQAAADVVDLFVSEGVIVKSSPRHGFATYEIAHRSGTHPNYPLVVLINGASASASEIVAGALQDSKHQRAILVGERSYGKGSVQVVTPFTGGDSQLKYTVAYYHLPSDQQVKNRYQMEKLGRKDWGIAPDVEVKVTSNELKDMLDLQRDNDVLLRGGSETGSANKKHSLDETVLRDPQLSMALIVVQSQLLEQGTELVLKDISQDEIRAARAAAEPKETAISSEDRSPVPQ
jgi:carboxyl-terminal processing protease